MGWYSEIVFPRVCDWLLDRPLFADERRRQLAGVSGSVLEIGIGGGLNLPHYPPGVRRITAVDPSPGMNRLLKRRTRLTGHEIDQRVGVAERLPMENASFDFVVSTLTLCSVADVEQALREVHRVLRPGGRFVFLEHGLAPDEAVRRWQRRLNPLQRIVGAGCRLDLDVRGAVEASPLAALRIERFYLDGIPRTHGCMYRGEAERAE